MSEMRLAWISAYFRRLGSVLGTNDRVFVPESNDRPQISRRIAGQSDMTVSGNPERLLCKDLVMAYLRTVGV